MNAFEQAGQAMLLAEQGRAQFGHALARQMRRLALRLQQWLANMPTTLPPTEPHRR